MAKVKLSSFSNEFEVKKYKSEVKNLTLLVEKGVSIYDLKEIRAFLKDLPKSMKLDDRILVLLTCQELDYLIKDISSAAGIIFYNKSLKLNDKWYDLPYVILIKTGIMEESGLTPLRVLAHELGHYHHKHFERGEVEHSVRELEADQFADYLIDSWDNIID